VLFVFFQPNPKQSDYSNTSNPTSNRTSKVVLCGAMDLQPRTQMPLATDASSKRCYKRRRVDSGDNGLGSSHSDAAIDIWATQVVVDFANNFGLTSPNPTAAFNTKEAQLMDQICQKVKPTSNRRDQGTSSHLNHAVVCCASTAIEIFAMLLKDATNGMPGVTVEIGSDWFMKYLDLQPAVPDIEVLDAFEQIVGKPRAQQCYSERGLQVGCIRALREAMDLQPRTQMPLATDASSKRCHKSRRIEHVTPVMDPEPRKVDNRYSPISCTRQMELTPESSLEEFLGVLLAPAPVQSGTAIAESTSTGGFKGNLPTAVDNFFDPGAPRGTSGFGMAISGSHSNHGCRPAVPRVPRAPSLMVNGVVQPAGFAVVNGVVLAVVNV
jgi:hypothetical protein